METTEITINTKLEKIVSDSGLQINEAEKIKQSYLPYFTQIAEIKEQAKKINFENPTELDEKIARELRLKTVKIRTGSELVKDERKRIHTLAANVEQTAWNLIKSGCLYEEEVFLQIEKKREIAEKKRVELLKIERIEKLSLYIENAAIYPLGEMSETAFEDLLNGSKLAKEAKLKAEREIELAKIEAENNAIRERARLKAENELLLKESATKEAALRIEREKVAADQKAFEDKSKKELAAKEAIRLAEQKKSDELLETQRKQAAEKLAKEKSTADAKLKKEREANEKLKAELLAKQEAERLEVAAKYAEMKAKKEAEAEALKAPDKIKLKKLVADLNFEIPAMGTNAFVIATEIKTKFESFKVWAEKQINSL